MPTSSGEDHAERPVPCDSHGGCRPWSGRLRFPVADVCHSFRTTRTAFPIRGCVPALTTIFRTEFTRQRRRRNLIMLRATLPTLTLLSAAAATFGLVAPAPAAAAGLTLK